MKCELNGNVIALMVDDENIDLTVNKQDFLKILITARTIWPELFPIDLDVKGTCAPGVRMRALEGMTSSLEYLIAKMRVENQVKQKYQDRDFLAVAKWRDGLQGELGRLRL
jgi:hypothetical protein